MDSWFENLTRYARECLHVCEGEICEDYRARLTQTLTPSQRAMIAAKVWENSRQDQKSKTERRRLWIAAARIAFVPGPRCPCAICSRYESVTEAHHVYPLSLQFDVGETIPLQEFCWLCPTHPRLIHEIIESLMANRQSRLEGVPLDERQKLDNAGVQFVNLWQRSRRLKKVSCAVGTVAA